MAADGRRVQRPEFLPGVGTEMSWEGRYSGEMIRSGNPREFGEVLSGRIAAVGDFLWPGSRQS